MQQDNKDPYTHWQLQLVYWWSYIQIPKARMAVFEKKVDGHVSRAGRRRGF